MKAIFLNSRFGSRHGTHSENLRFSKIGDDYSGKDIQDGLFFRFRMRAPPGQDIQPESGSSSKLNEFEIWMFDAKSRQFTSDFQTAVALAMFDPYIPIQTHL